MILVVAESRANRDFLAMHREVLRVSFPLDTRSLMAALSRGVSPAADGIVVL
jgi:hypothetical protein